MTQKKSSILIVDDDDGQRSLLSSFLEKNNFTTEMANSGEEALNCLTNKQYSMMISDVRMPGISGLETMQRAREEHPTLPVLLVTGYADIRDAVVAMKDGALNYLEKPIDLDELLEQVQRALGADTTTPSTDIPPLLDNIIAQSPSMKDLFQETAFVAPTESRVLITGESGTGKEVMADQIHAWSQRSTGPLIKINCAAIPENLLESELFGHEKGAFTGAVQQREGRFVAAAGGTIFLDEIGEMPLVLQAKLLRVIQDGTFLPVGSNREQHSDARVLAATNCNLEAAVGAGTFREDLFYRLNVMELFIPPLRERQEDILPLASLFISHFSSTHSRLSAAVSSILSLYAWPGNVRELRNSMERAVLMARGGVILPEHLPHRIHAPQKQNDASPSEGKKLEDIEQNVILQTLQEHNHNRTETAKSLGISRRALLYKIRRMKDMGIPCE